MEFKGTSGEWKFVHTNQHPTEKNEWHSVIQMPKIAISVINTKFLSKEETKANAQLIASAPELLEALLNLTIAVASGQCRTEIEVEQAKQAIEKATKIDRLR